MAYTKLFSTIVTSTVWGEPHTTRIVWITMLAIANKDGEVMATIPGLARLANVSIQETEDAVKRFLCPDPYSRTPDDEGRRIEKIEGGWQLLNYQKYRRMASLEEAREQNAERQRRHRERVARNAPSVTGNAGVTVRTDIAEAEAEAEAKETLFAEASPSAEKTRKKRQPNALLEAIPAACGQDPAQVTGSTWSAYGKILREIKEVCPTVTPEEVHRRAACYRRKYPSAAITPHALAKHWAEFPQVAPVGIPVPAIAPTPEPPGWKDILAREFPNCPYAPGQYQFREWALCSPSTRAAIEQAIRPYLPSA